MDSPRRTLAFIATFEGGLSTLLKRRLFLSRHSFQKTNLGSNIQTVLSRSFLERWKGEDSTQLERISAVKEGIKKLRILVGRTSCQTSLEKGQERSKWSMFSS
jgi:hypothetical protein